MLLLFRFLGLLCGNWAYRDGIRKAKAQCELKFAGDVNGSKRSFYCYINSKMLNKEKQDIFIVLRELADALVRLLSVSFQKVMEICNDCKKANVDPLPKKAKRSAWSKTSMSTSLQSVERSWSASSSSIFLGMSRRRRILLHRTYYQDRLQTSQYHFSPWEGWGAYPCRNHF